MIKLSYKQVGATWLVVTLIYFATVLIWYSSVFGGQYEELKHFHVRYLSTFFIYLIVSGFAVRSFGKNHSGFGAYFVLFVLLMIIPTVTAVQFYTPDQELLNHFAGEKEYSPIYGVRLTPFVISIYTGIKYLTDGSLPLKWECSNITIMHVFSILINLMLWVGACLLLRFSKTK